MLPKIKILVILTAGMAEILLGMTLMNIHYFHSPLLNDWCWRFAAGGFCLSLIELKLLRDRRKNE